MQKVKGFNQALRLRVRSREDGYGCPPVGGLGTGLDKARVPETKRVLRRLGSPTTGRRRGGGASSGEGDSDSYSACFTHRGHFTHGLSFHDSVMKGLKRPHPNAVGRARAPLAGFLDALEPTWPTVLATPSIRTPARTRTHKISGKIFRRDRAA